MANKTKDKLKLVEKSWTKHGKLIPPQLGPPEKSKDTSVSPDAETIKKLRDAEKTTVNKKEKPKKHYSVSAAQKAGEKYFYDKNTGQKKLAVTAEQLPEEVSLRQFANKWNKLGKRPTASDFTKVKDDRFHSDVKTDSPYTQPRPKGRKTRKNIYAGTPSVKKDRGKQTTTTSRKTSIGKDVLGKGPPPVKRVEKKEKANNQRKITSSWKDIFPVMDFIKNTLPRSIQNEPAFKKAYGGRPKGVGKALRGYGRAMGGKVKR